MPIRYQGEDIPITIALSGADASEIHDFEDMTRLVLYLYCNRAKIVMFEWREDGEETSEKYHQLTLSDDKMTLTGILSREDTADLYGQMFADILVITPNDRYTIRRANAGVDWHTTPISREMDIEEEE